MNRILYVSDAGSIHTQRWAKHFAESGIEVHVASFRAAKIKNVTVHLIPTLGIGKLGYIYAIPYLRNLVIKINPDIVHAQYVTSYGFLAAISNLKPLIITAWGTDVLITPNKSWLLRKFIRYALHKADKVTTVAKHMNKAITDFGISDDAILAVPFGIDTELFHLPAQRPSDTPLRIISTRNFAEIYSIHTVIDAFHEIINQGHDAILDLVGKGPLLQALKKQVESLNLNEKVFFHGHVSHEQLVSLLGNAHIFVSSALSDGNNISLNEAMACGCYPIATDIPANSQWITHQYNGLLYKKGDSSELTKMLILASDKSLRKKSRSINREIVEKNADWLTCANLMNNTYLELQKKV